MVCFSSVNHLPACRIKTPGISNNNKVLILLFPLSCYCFAERVPALFYPTEAATFVKCREESCRCGINSSPHCRSVKSSRRSAFILLLGLKINPLADFLNFYTVCCHGGTTSSVRVAECRNRIKRWGPTFKNTYKDTCLCTFDTSDSRDIWVVL